MNFKYQTIVSPKLPKWQFFKNYGLVDSENILFHLKDVIDIPLLFFLFRLDSLCNLLASYQID